MPPAAASIARLFQPVTERAPGTASAEEQTERHQGRCRQTGQSCSRRRVPRARPRRRAAIQAAAVASAERKQTSAAERGRDQHAVPDDDLGFEQDRVVEQQQDAAEQRRGKRRAEFEEQEHEQGRDQDAGDRRHRAQRDDGRVSVGQSDVIERELAVESAGPWRRPRSRACRAADARRRCARPCSNTRRRTCRRSPRRRRPAAGRPVRRNGSARRRSRGRRAPVGRGRGPRSFARGGCGDGSPVEP